MKPLSQNFSVKMPSNRNGKPDGIFFFFSSELTNLKSDCRILETLVQLTKEKKSHVPINKMLRCPRNGSDFKSMYLSGEQNYLKELTLAKCDQQNCDFSNPPPHLFPAIFKTKLTWGGNPYGNTQRRMEYQTISELGYFKPGALLVSEGLSKKSFLGYYPRQIFQ